MSQLASYRSHKTVKAGKIAGLDTRDGFGNLFIPVLDENNSRFDMMLPHDIFARGLR